MKFSLLEVAAMLLIIIPFSYGLGYKDSKNGLRISDDGKVKNAFFVIGIILATISITLRFAR